jgi:hypothetical protein
MITIELQFRLIKEKNEAEVALSLLLPDLSLPPYLSCLPYRSSTRHIFLVCRIFLQPAISFSAISFPAISFVADMAGRVPNSKINHLLPASEFSSHHSPPPETYTCNHGHDAVLNPPSTHNNRKL